VEHVGLQRTDGPCQPKTNRVRPLAFLRRKLTALVNLIENTTKIFRRRCTTPRVKLAEAKDVRALRELFVLEGEIETAREISNVSTDTTKARFGAVDRQVE